MRVQPYRWFTSWFLHQSFTHVLSNMLLFLVIAIQARTCPLLTISTIPKLQDWLKTCLAVMNGKTNNAEPMLAASEVRASILRVPSGHALLCQLH
jgi:hypothetical protein